MSRILLPSASQIVTLRFHQKMRLVPTRYAVNYRVLDSTYSSELRPHRKTEELTHLTPQSDI